MIVRPMQPEDYRGLVELWSSFPGNAMTGADSEAGFTSFLKRNGSYCFAAVDSDGIVGSVMAGEDSRRGYIYHLAVRKELHRSGTGRLLMDTVEKALYEAGIEKIHLFIFSDNPAIEFYRKTGWHLRNDIEVMSKVLRGDRYMGTMKL
ncbi:GNAT family N-acetyltransferase [Candidatus Fermentibacteria bacterium]|nr:MAG: GNAT family N-acetyltransferase [Candidatus Fermentibacteria bacterium]